MNFSTLLSGVTFEGVLSTVNDFIWGWPLIIFILVAGVFLSCRLVFLQIRKLPLAFKYMIKNETEGDGQMSAFASLCTELSATIGTGNIVAVFIGPYMTISAVWTIADIFNGLMALPNLIAVVSLSGVVKETKDYFARLKKQKDKSGFMAEKQEDDAAQAQLE